MRLAVYGNVQPRPFDSANFKCAPVPFRLVAPIAIALTGNRHLAGNTASASISQGSRIFFFAD